MHNNLSYKLQGCSSSCDWILTVLKIWNFDVNAKEIGCHMATGLVFLFFFVFAIGLVGVCVEMPFHKNSESEAKGLTLSN